MFNTVKLSLLLFATSAPQITLQLPALVTEKLVETVVAL
jgi:hypothetical protein